MKTNQREKTRPLSEIERKRLKREQNRYIKVLSSKRRYCGNGLPRQPVPTGFFLVHNRVNPVRSLGLNGFRAWVQEGKGHLVRCHCDFGGMKHAELHKHYRVGRPDPRLSKFDRLLSN
jgi:hypothetical protein